MSAINLFFLLLLIVSDFAIAIPWNGPRPTGVDIFGADWSPAPTNPPSPLDLFRRAGQYPLWVCGFIAGNLAVPATCSSGSTCVWFNDLNAIGCCTSSGTQCTYPTACLDGGSPSRTPDPNDPFTMTCANSEGARECYTNAYPQGYTEVGCGYRSWATTVETNGAPDMSVFVTFKPANHNPATFSGGGGSSTNSSPSPSPPGSSGSSSGGSSTNSSPSPSTSGSPGSSSGSSSGSSTGGSSSRSGSSSSSTNRSSASSTRSGSSTTGDPTSSSESTTAAGAAGGATQAQSGSSSNTGAIIGGVVGGIAAVLALAALIAWSLIRRRRRQRDPIKEDPSPAAAAAAFADEKPTTPQGRAELPSFPGSPELADTSPRASQRVSELYGREVSYRPYRPPQGAAAELPG